MKTTTGTYHGIVDRDHIDFLGIPYGYGRRFKRAEKFSITKFGSNEVDKLHYAVHHGIQPMQNEALNQSDKVTFGENCLNLDICTPDIEGKYPIVIEFYGGGFLRGGNYTKQMSWLDHESIVHIVPNYRLGLFGWGKVQGGDSNVGLSDQLMAIQWVIDNAKNFGGDVENITLAGLSAGAKTISALMASNSQLLDQIQKIILFSGGLQTIRDLQTAEKVSDRICQENHIKSTQDLFNLTDDGLQLVQERSLDGHIATNWFGPVIDDDLISADWQEKLLQRANRTHFKTIISASSNELVQLKNRNISDLEDMIMTDLFGENRKVLKQNLLPATYSKNDFVKMLGVAMYSLPARRMAELLAENTDAEVYCSISNVLDGQHGSAIQYLNTPEEQLNIDYRKNRQYLLELLREFIVNGKPYVEEIKYEWPAFDADRLILELDPDDLKSVSVINQRYPDDLPWQTYKI